MQLRKLLSICLLTAAISVTVPVNKAQALVVSNPCSSVSIIVASILAGTYYFGRTTHAFKVLMRNVGRHKLGWFAGGAVVLNDSGKLRFDRLSAQEAAKLNLNSDDVAAYNDEVHILNAIAFEMQNELGGQEYAGLSNEELATASAEFFNESYADTLSSGTIRVLGSITL